MIATDHSPMWRDMRVSCLLLACLIGSTLTRQCLAQESRAAVTEPQKWAVIVVGLPGDKEHDKTFRDSADQIQKWLVESLQFPEGHIVRMPRETTDRDVSSGSLTAADIRSTLADVNQKLQAQDSLWVFTLGHGNYDGKRAWFHVAGRDASAEDFGRWFADIRCREQVIWLTHSSSGWFLKPLSKPGRIVMTATAADDEANETEFPHALAAVSQQPAAQLDANRDQLVSVDELYAAIVQEVLRRFKSDNRLPTEHAQLDDNGDGVGTESILQSESEFTASQAAKPPQTKTDGALARTTHVPYRLKPGSNVDRSQINSK